MRKYKAVNGLKYSQVNLVLAFVASTQSTYIKQARCNKYVRQFLIHLISTIIKQFSSSRNNLLQSWQNLDICFFVILITIAKISFLEEKAGDQTVFPTNLEFFLIPLNFPRILMFLAIREVPLVQSLIQYISNPADETCDKILWPGLQITNLLFPTKNFSQFLYQDNSQSVEQSFSIKFQFYGNTCLFSS